MSRQDKVLSIISRSNPEKDFELLKQIGRGTYGDVYKVTRYPQYVLYVLYLLYVLCVLYVLILYLGGPFHATIHHSETRNLTGTLLTEVCHDVSLGPVLQPLTGEVFNHATSSHEVEARVDVAAKDFL